MADSMGNTPEYSVSELAGAVKRTVEDAFGHVRVRGELGRVTIAKSGHVYFDIKDDRAVINAIAWKGTAARFRFRPEEGLEVIIEGRMSTYPGRSQYQLIVDTMEPAGAGALMALLEERKKALAAEGLFATERKQALPFLPQTIGVVTSPTGAVIRDILHRVRDRFPRHVLVWPVLVQGDQAAAQIAGAIRGFNALTDASAIPRPDVLIVARGGGSIEDLWAFNEEIVVRAAAESQIPLISAVGHETDTTLIDFVSDRRAPTPTGAAEMAVPVRVDLVASLQDYNARLVSGLSRLLERRRTELRGLARALPNPAQFLALKRQGFDLVAERLDSLARAGLTERRSRLAVAAAGLKPAALERDIRQKLDRARDLASRLAPAFARGHRDRRQALQNWGERLDALSHQSVLKRGFVLVRDHEGGLVRQSADLNHGAVVSLEFADGRRAATVGEGTSPPPTSVSSPPVSQAPASSSRAVSDKKTPRKRSAKPGSRSSDSGQGQLF